MNMSLLTNLVTQVAQSALQGQIQKQANQSGLGGILGSVLGGNQQQQTNQGGLGNILGSVLGGANQNNPQANVLGQVLGSVLGGNQQQSGINTKNMLMLALLPIALNWIQQNGGLSGALGKLSQLGLGQQVNSWMSTNQNNQSLNANDITKLFGNQEIQQVANQTGCQPNEVCQGMASLLPQIFDSLTPDGDTSKEKQANAEINDILAQISKLAR